MVKHVWSVLCSRAVVDRDSNNVSLQNVIEQFVVKGAPGADTRIIPDCDLMTLWVRDDPGAPARGESKIVWRSPAGNEQELLRQEIDLTKYARLRSRLHLEKLQAPEAGRYWFVIQQRSDGHEGWAVAATVPLQIDFTPEPDETDDAR